MRLKPGQTAAIGLVMCSMTHVSAQQKYDLLLKGGHVIDPRNKISAVRDVAIANGKVAAVAANIAPAEAFKVVGSELNRRRSNGGRMAAQQSISPNSSPGRQCGGEDQVHLPGCSTRFPSGLIRPSYLPQDLGFAQNLRVEPSRNPEQMPYRIETVVLIQRHRWPVG